MMLSTEMFVLPEMVGSASCEAMLQTETFSTKLQLYVSVFQCTCSFVKGSGEHKRAIFTGDS